MAKKINIDKEEIVEKSLDELISDTKKSLSQKNYDDALKNLNLIVKKDSNNLSDEILKLEELKKREF